MQQIHEHRRIQYFGTKEEKKQIAGHYRQEVDFQVNIGQAKKQEEGKRDKFETERCQDLFNKQVEEARRQDLAKKEALRRNAEENRMLADSKRRQQMTDHVTEAMHHNKLIEDSKVKPPTMFR